MQPSDISPQASRENPDPGESSGPIPVWVFVMSAVLIVFCAYYIVRSDSASAPAVSAEIPGVDGAAIYAARCVACHQATGAGLAGVFPPLAGSNWINGADATLIQILLHGIQGSLTVNGTTYNGVMPPFGTQLSDAEIAAVLTHVRSHFGNQGAAVTVQQVAAQRAATASRSGPWNGDADLSQLH